MAGRLRLDTPVIHAEQLLIYRVLLRDQPASPTSSNRYWPTGYRPRRSRTLLITSMLNRPGAVSTETARQLHLPSARSLPARRIRTLTRVRPHQSPHNDSPSRPQCSAPDCSAGHNTTNCAALTTTSRAQAERKTGAALPEIGRYL